MFLPQVSSDHDKILKKSPTCSESGMSLKKSVKTKEFETKRQSQTFTT